MKYIMTTIAILSLSVISIATPISGDISGIISSENSPYEVVGDLRVPQDESLEIQAGCIFDFQGNYTFTIDTSAVFKALGAPDDSIVFTATNVNPGWGSLRFFSCGDTCILNHCIIEHSFARSIPPLDQTFGGGIYTINSNLVIKNSSIRKNEAYEGSGGGIFIGDSCFVEIIESEIVNNKSSWDGAGICCTKSDISISSSIISADTSRYVLGSGWGGGLSITRSNVLIDNCIISDNYCGQSGGGVLLSQSTVNMKNNKILCNAAFEAAGGISFTNCPELNMVNNIIAFNSTQYGMGGGVMVGNTNGVISNNTIYGNNGAAFSGGFHIANSTISNLENNIIWANSVNNDQIHPNAQIIDLDSTLSFIYSCIQNGWPGEGNIDSDPLFADPDNGDFQITWANYPIEDETKSPCIDTGAPWSPLDPDSTHADMGALYFNQWINDIDDPIALPERVQLHQNYPNPFNASTLISYELPIASQVKLDIYDILGRHIATLEDGTQPAGSHQVVWNADELASGVYFYKLQAKEYNATRKLMLIK